MRPLDFPLLADENIHPEVLDALVAAGADARSILTEGLGGKDDREILGHAYVRGWVVLTHDSDFGTLAIRNGEPYTGIIYVRPGHIAPGFVLEILDAVRTLPVETLPPFVIVAERREQIVRVRVRSVSA